MINIIDKYNKVIDDVSINNKKLLRSYVSRLLSTHNSNHEFGFLVSINIEPEYIYNKIKNMFSYVQVYMMDRDYITPEKYYAVYLTRSISEKDKYMIVHIFEDNVVMNRSKTVWTSTDSIFTIENKRSI